MKSFFMKSIQSLALIAFVSSLLILSGCGDDPEKENIPELITKATLTFTPVGGGSAVVVTATDPDLDGPQDIEIDGAIVLSTNTTYDLSITLINELADPTDEEYDITAEVEEEGDEHMFFFAWTNNLFSNPAGNGNIDARADALNYQDTDGTNPIGLETRWVTGAGSGTGTFRVVLKHQPDAKTATSGSDVGESDLDLTFEIETNS